MFPIAWYFGQQMNLEQMQMSVEELIKHQRQVVVSVNANPEVRHLEELLKSVHI